MNDQTLGDTGLPHKESTVGLTHHNAIVRSLNKEIERLREIINPGDAAAYEIEKAAFDKMRELLYEVATSGSEMQDKRLGYVEIQLNVDTWEAIQDLKEVLKPI